MTHSRQRTDFPRLVRSAQGAREVAQVLGDAPRPVELDQAGDQRADDDVGLDKGVHARQSGDSSWTWRYAFLRKMPRMCRKSPRADRPSEPAPASPRIVLGVSPD